MDALKKKELSFSLSLSPVCPVMIQNTQEVMEEAREYEPKQNVSENMGVVVYRGYEDRCCKQSLKLNVDFGGIVTVTTCQGI